MKDHWMLLLLLCSILGMAGAQITQVWPGDVNENGQVSHVDFLYLGLHFGNTGPGRDSISINWTAHDVLKWLPPVTGRPDPSHSDCNGDSTIDLLDVVAIETNYGLDNGFIQTEPSSFVSSGGAVPPLSFSFSGNPMVGGTTDTIWLDLGDALNPVDSLLGFATSVNLDSSLVDTAYAWFGDSWLGTPGTDLISFDRYEPGTLHLAATRTDQANANQGNGRVAGIVVVMVDNLKKAVEVESLQLDFSQGLALTTGIQVVDVFPVTSQAAVYFATEELELLVYPVPASERIQVSVLAGAEEGFALRLFSTQGALVRQHLSRSSHFSLERAGLLKGIYLLEIQVGEAVLRKKVIFFD